MLILLSRQIARGLMALLERTGATVSALIESCSYLKAGESA